MKNSRQIMEVIADNPIILAVKNKEELKKAIKEEAEIIFLLGSNIIDLPEDVNLIKENGKFAIIHLDLIEGLSLKEVSVDFIKSHTKADGIISTKPKIVKRASELGLFSVLRQFLIDSLALENLEKNIVLSNPDMVEILPGVMPKIIEKISKKVKVPIIAGGLISDKEDVISSLKSGAIAISTSNSKIWKL